MPTAEETGHCSLVRLDDISDTNVVIFEHTGAEESSVCTIAIKSATQNLMDDLERAVDDAVNNFKLYTKVNNYQSPCTEFSST